MLLFFACHVCILPCFYDFWHYHPYILQHLLLLLFHRFLLCMYIFKSSELRVCAHAQALALLCCIVGRVLM